jgi:hypothetical protein
MFDRSSQPPTLQLSPTEPAWAIKTSAPRDPRHASVVDCDQCPGGGLNVTVQHGDGRYCAILSSVRAGK